MYPAAFEYRAPKSLDEALDVLEQEGDQARILAGGQSLIPMMKLRLANPALLVDINGLPDLDYIQQDDGHLRVGALVRHNDIVNSDLVLGSSPMMAAAAPWISDPLVRNRGTMCGSVAHCDPEGDWNSVMLALGGEVVATGPSGQRVIPISDFIQDFFTNSLAPEEMVTEVRVPVYSGAAGGTYLKLERKIGDYATVGVATHLQLDGSGRIADAGIALTSVAPHNLKAVDAEQVLIGEAPSEELFREAGRLAAQAADPESDVRGPAEYKRGIVDVYTRRGLATSLDIAQGA